VFTSLTNTGAEIIAKYFRIRVQNAFVECPNRLLK